MVNCHLNTTKAIKKAETGLPHNEIFFKTVLLDTGEKSFPFILTITISLTMYISSSATSFSFLNQSYCFSNTPQSCNIWDLDAEWHSDCHVYFLSPQHRYLHLWTVVNHSVQFTTGGSKRVVICFLPFPTRWMTTSFVNILKGFLIRNQHNVKRKAAGYFYSIL